MTNSSDWDVDNLLGSVMHRHRGVWLACVHVPDDDDDYDAFPTRDRAKAWVRNRVHDVHGSAKRLRWEKRDDIVAAVLLYGDTLTWAASR